MEEQSLKVHVGGMVATNGYLLVLGDDVFVIDAPKGMYEFVKNEGKTPTALLLTHQHYDHVEDAALFSNNGIPIYAYQQHSPPLIMQDLAQKWGANIQIQPFQVTNELKVKNMISVGKQSICTIHVPGHSPDSIVFYFAGKQFLFAGDTLFRGSIGRTDLPLGDHDSLLNGIKNDLLALDEDTLVFPGHGESTTIAEEAKTNPFLR